MKKILSVLAIMLAVVANSYSQNTCSAEKDLLYSEYKVTCSGKTKKQVWNAVKRWVALNFNTYKFTADYENEEDGELVVKCYTTPSRQLLRYWDLKCFYVLDIIAKDGGYSISRKNGSFQAQPNREMANANEYSTPDFLLENMKEESKRLNSAIGENGKLSIDELFDNIRTIESCLAGQPKYKTPKDEKKGRVNAWYEIYTSDLDILTKITRTYYMGYNELQKSLEKSF